MVIHRKWTTVKLCKTARSAIQLFYIYYRKYFAIILNSAVYLSSARVNMFHTLVPLVRIFEQEWGARPNELIWMVDNNTVYLQLMSLRN